MAFVALNSVKDSSSDSTITLGFDPATSFIEVRQVAADGTVTLISTIALT